MMHLMCNYINMQYMYHREIVIELVSDMSFK